MSRRRGSGCSRSAPSRSAVRLRHSPSACAPIIGCGGSSSRNRESSWSSAMVRSVLKTKSISHGTLGSKDLEATRRFYEEFLGLEVVRTSPVSLMIRLGGNHVYAVVYTKKKERMPRVYHNGLDVATDADVDEAWRACHSQAQTWGLHDIGKPSARHGTYSFLFWDADDNAWEILSNPKGGRAFGTAAEYVAIPSENAVSLPEGASFEIGACLGIAGMTAHRCLFRDGGIQGQTVLVAGGGGAVGHAAIQLAKWGGARVATTVSRPEQEKVARGAGADLVVHRKTDDAAERIRAFTRGPGVDRVVEVAFEANLELNRAVLKANGVIATYSSGPSDSAPRIPFTAIMRQGISVHFVLVYVMPREAHWAAARDLNAALEAGRYRPHVAGIFKLDETAKAHEAQESGGTVGKLLVGI